MLKKDFFSIRERKLTSFMILKLIKIIHHKFVLQRRVEVIANEIIKQIPSNINILDIGCGDGRISYTIIKKIPNIKISGIDIMKRPFCLIPYENFDGINIPYPQNSFDAILLVDVLHHTFQIKELLNNAASVSKKYIIIKDHIFNNKIDLQVLKFMDWVGNAPHGVKIVYNYKNVTFWNNLFKELNLEVISINKHLPLYPPIFNLIFGKNLHFIVVLKIA